MKIIGISGWSGNGKTTLLDKLIPQLNDRGFTVSTLKHAHHKFDIDHEGKDSYRHREAGAQEVMISSSNRWALIHENRTQPESSFTDLTARMSNVDILLVEGFKTEDFPKIEIWRDEVKSAFLHENNETVVAVAADVDLPNCPLPVLNLNQAADIADFIVTYLKLETGTGNKA